jgi:wyosine [tRNA(Phe)-imidazoG37] synthetase (radical SAM superfamily)
VARIASAVDAVSVSLNAPDAAAYVELCRPCHGERAFEAVLEHIRQCREQLGEVTATVVGVALSASQLAQCRELADDLGVPLRVR